MVGKAADLGVWALLCFKKKLFSAKKKEASRRYLGGTDFGEKMVGLGESTSRNPERKKGHPYPSVLKKFYKSVFKRGNVFCHF